MTGFIHVMCVNKELLVAPLMCNLNFLFYSVLSVTSLGQISIFVLIINFNSLTDLP